MSLRQTAFSWPGILLAGFVLVLAIAGVIYKIDPPSQQVVPTTESNKNERAKSSSTATKEKQLFSVIPAREHANLAALESQYPIDHIVSYRISAAAGADYELDVARYSDAENQHKQAIIYLPAKTNKKGKVLAGGDKASHFRYEKWLAAAQAIKKHTDNNALFVTFWDNAQRVHLFTGRAAWTLLPDQNAYRSSEEQTMWGAIAGGFDSSGRLAKYSRHLLQDADAAISAMTEELPTARGLYLLVSTDDLSHVQELATLSGQGLPLETKLFPAQSDLHNSISKVKDWAKEDDGTGSYLLQPVSEQSIRVWRITDKEFEDTLLARLLPFTSSLNRPVDNIKLVYQSDWGAYLSIYEVGQR